MKVSEYRQMMAYLTRPRFNGGGSVGNKGGGSVGNKTVLPKKKPEKEVKKRKLENFEKAKPALENPKEVKEMMNFKVGGIVNVLSAFKAAFRGKYKEFLAKNNRYPSINERTKLIDDAEQEIKTNFPEEYAEFPNPSQSFRTIKGSRVDKDMEADMERENIGFFPMTQEDEIRRVMDDGPGLNMGEYFEFKKILNRPDFLLKRGDKADGGRIGFSKGGMAQLVAILNELPAGTNITRELVRKVIADNNIDVSENNFFSRTPDTLKKNLNVIKQKSRIKITPEILKEFDNYVKNTDLDIKSIGEKFGYAKKKGKTGLSTSSLLFEEYVKAYGEPEPGRFKKFRLTVDDPIVQKRLDKVRELGSIKAAAKDLKIDRRVLAKQVAKFDPELLKEIGAGQANIPGPETGKKATKKRAEEAIKEAKKKAGPKTTAQADTVINKILDKNKIYANMSAEDLAKDKNFLKRLRLRINSNSGAVDFTGYTETNPVRGKVFNDVELAQHAIDKAKKGELIAPDHITPKKFRKQNVGYPINFQPVTYMENSQFENARTFLTNNPSSNVAPINNYLKSNNKTIRFKIDNNRYKYGYKGDIEFNSKTGNQTLLDFEKNQTVAKPVGEKTNRSIFGKIAKGFGRTVMPLGTPTAAAGFSKSLFLDPTLESIKKGEKIKSSPLQNFAIDVSLPISAVAPTAQAMNLFGPSRGGFFKRTAKDIAKTAFGGGYATRGLDALSRMVGLQSKRLGPGIVSRFVPNLFRAATVPSIYAAPLVETAIQGYNAYNRLQKAREKYGMDDTVTTALGSAPRQYVQELISELPEVDRSGAAGGGIMKMAGKSSGPPPEAGPTPQGLAFILKRDR